MSQGKELKLDIFLRTRETRDTMSVKNSLLHFFRESEVRETIKAIKWPTMETTSLVVVASRLTPSAMTYEPRGSFTRWGVVEFMLCEKFRVKNEMERATILQKCLHELLRARASVLVSNLLLFFY